MKVKVGGYEFVETDMGAEVYYRRQFLGEIVTMHEPSGRHCFSLGCDHRKNPRTYRGRIKAADALKAIHTLIQQHNKEGWSLENLIVRAWDSKPSSAEKA